MFGLGGPPKVALKLERDEALVLFELLARWIDDAPRPTPSAECFESPSEIHVLREVMERLKADLSEPFRADYLDILATARDRLSQDVIGETLQD
jgi:hypothetical protein